MSLASVLIEDRASKIKIQNLSKTCKMVFWQARAWPETQYMCNQHSLQSKKNAIHNNAKLQLTSSILCLTCSTEVPKDSLKPFQKPCRKAAYCKYPPLSLAFATFSFILAARSLLLYGMNSEERRDSLLQHSYGEQTVQRLQFQALARPTPFPLRPA